MKNKSIIILGAGNWGTTLAIEFSKSFNVRLWTRDQKERDEINAKNENVQFLPGIKLPDSIRVEEKFESKIEKTDWVLLVVPSAVMASVCTELKNHIHTNQIVINASKGVQSGTLQTMSSLIVSILGSDIQLVALTGPTIAKEIAAGEPARAVLSSKKVATLLELKKQLDLPHLGFEMSRDIEGAELSAALKGIVAIAVGITDGLGLHTNMQGVIMTYALNEFKVIADFLGIPETTIYGLSGMGDLITTCISPDSRNRRFGKLLVEGFAMEQALEKVGMVVEGVELARTIDELAHFNLNIPLFRTLAKIIFNRNLDVRSELLNTIQSIN